MTRACKPKVIVHNGLYIRLCTVAPPPEKLSSPLTVHSTLEAAIADAQYHYAVGHTFGACCRHGDKRCRKEECEVGWLSAMPVLLSSTQPTKHHSHPEESSTP